MENYKHLTQNERDKLAVLRSRGWKLRDIGRVLGRNPGTLSRELKRNNSRIAYMQTRHILSIIWCEDIKRAIPNATQAKRGQSAFPGEFRYRKDLLSQISVKNLGIGKQT